MTWSEIGQDHLLAARGMCIAHPRSAVSRAYDSAHVALAGELASQGYALKSGRQTPPHRDQKRLIRKYLRASGVTRVRELRRLMGQLYGQRLDADYSRLAAIDKVVAKQAVKNARSVLDLLTAKGG